MSVRNFMVQYVGNVLKLPKFEREVSCIVEYETGREYYPVRTCKRVSYDGNGKPQLVCSACGCGMGKALDRYCYVNYCPACGAKVVKDGN